MTSGLAVAPYGSWWSPISAELVAAGAVGLSSPSVDGEDRYWLESRPLDHGRRVLVRQSREAAAADVTPAGFSIRTRVHEYGGGDHVVSAGAVVFANAADQRLWRQDPGCEPVALTTEPAGRGPDVRSVRFADGRLTPDRAWLVSVRETHHGATAAQVDNELVAVRVDGAGEAGRAEERVLATGRDFYSFPRLSADGSRLAWTCWDHPAMPWDGTELWVADVSAHGGGPSLTGARQVAGGARESVFQPEWGPDGTLHLVSDRDGWWNLYRWDGAGLEALTGLEAELGRPQWVFGLSTYAFLADGRIVACWASGGTDHLGLLESTGRRGKPVELDVAYTAMSGLRATGDGVVLVGAGPRTPAEVAEIAIGPDGRAGAPLVLARSRALEMHPGDVAEAEPVEVPGWDGGTVHAFFYRPANARLAGPPHERPPLIVTCHGGPTGAASPSLDLGVQYWTSRGIAVMDVDYGGSTGYGRAYRERLRGRWGLVDADDCVAAALWLVERGEVDRERLAIRGRSAGGYTTLCALTFRDLFRAGASYYGVADAASLAAETHKFESHYTDGLIGPWPEAAEEYRRRSPLAHADLVSCPVAFFQGLDDPIVPPSQAEAMVEALRSRGIPHAYLGFEGEQHGFRQAATVQRCLEAEQSFYAAVLGFDLADDIEPVAIEDG